MNRIHVTKLHLVVWMSRWDGSLVVHERPRQGSHPTFSEHGCRAALNLCIHIFLNVSPFFVGQITQTEKAGWKGECVFNYQGDGPIVFLADVPFCVPASGGECPPPPPSSGESCRGLGMVSN